MPPRLVEGGIIKTPLYHGTSTLFLDSIERHGLGSIDPLQHYSARAFLRKVYELCDQAFAGEKDWEACKFSASWMVNQECFGDNANFQHGHTYLTPGRIWAVGYALTNRFGSELITQANRLYGFLSERRPDLMDSSELNSHPLVEVFSMKPEPVLIVARDVPLDNLLSEGGASPQQALERIEQLWQVLPSHVAPNINFRLKVPLLPRFLSFERLDQLSEHNPFDW